MVLLTKVAVVVCLSLQLCIWAHAFERNARLLGRQDGLCAALVLPQGNYNCDEYVVKTDDGFLLGVQRLAAASAGDGTSRSPVFLMHGILSGGDTWVLNPPDQSLGFILADSGYDVWIGNFRTTAFSHGHVSYTRREKGFWDWSVDELAEKDLVTMLELAYKTTNQKLHYIGYSQGTQAAFAALSEGLLVDWVDRIVMVAPIAYVIHTTTPIGVAAAKLRLDLVFGNLPVYSLSTKTSSGRQLVDLICAAANMRCFNNWVTIFTGVNCCVNDTRRPIYDKYETQSTSTKNLEHFGQQFRHGKFAKYDYGSSRNMERYNSNFPPSYDLSKVPTQSMLLIHGKNDALSDVEDVRQLTNELTEGYKIVLVEDYAHIDFIVGFNARSKAYDEILSFLEN